MPNVRLPIAPPWPPALAPRMAAMHRLRTTDLHRRMNSYDPAVVVVAADVIAIFVVVVGIDVIVCSVFCLLCWVVSSVAVHDSS